MNGVHDAMADFKDGLSGDELFSNANGCTPARWNTCSTPDTRLS
jgi:hypothetical protein